MKPLNFLRSVAAYAVDGGSGRPSLEEYVFVLPNKRSAMFLKKYVRELVRGITLMPKFMTMRTFLSLHSTAPEASQRELLFILYDAYRKAMALHGREAGVREFDSFVFWGDMMLSDFDDIDKSLVNADDLFKNLRDVKEIQADYLDADQKDVIRRIWGESRLTADADRFWLHVGNDDSDASLSAKFVYLWEILADVYHIFHGLLEEKGLSSAGAQYKSALKAVRELEVDRALSDTHYAFVGFNDLSTAETLIFERLQKTGIASFFWDTAPLKLVEGAPGDAMPRPLRRLARLVEHFPMPDDYVVPVDASTDRSIDVLAVPSNVGQAKALNSVLESLRGEIDADDAIDTAVVLPDQGLLLPALLSVPDYIGSINISMGLPYRTTTFASLFHSIISMQLRAREIRGVINFFYEDVNAVLSHPHIRTVARDEADAVSARIVEDKLYNVPASEITDAAPAFKAVFAPVRSLGSVEDVADYLTGLFDWLSERFAASKGSTNGIADGFESEAIGYFRKEVENLAGLAKAYGVTMTDRTFLHLFERIFNQRGINVNGTPLAGLQMLGVLETRALDFDNVMVLSMNERIFPRRQYTKTMIPAALRGAFGLPDFESLEWTYAYCFYRLMARARRVTLMYDSRTEGVGNGEISRYILQMQYLMPSLKLNFKTLGYDSGNSKGSGIAVAKTAEVMSLLDRFRAGGPLRLSASAFKTYKACPMCFYLKYVRNMRGSDELTDYMLPSQFGTAVHNTVQALFEPYKNKTVSASTYDSWLAEDNTAIDEIARRQIIAERYPRASAPDKVVLSVDADIASKLVASIARENLRAERDFYCADGQIFTFIENEMKVNDVWEIDKELKVNFFMAIDRVDRMSDGRLRFVDFKTGGDDIVSENVDGLLANGDKDGIFQLFIYSQAYIDMIDDSAEVMPVLHSMRRFSAGEDLKLLKVGGSTVNAYSAYRSDFEPKFKDFVRDIFNPDKAFEQCEGKQACKYCKFKTMCGRIDAKY